MPGRDRSHPGVRTNRRVERALARQRARRRRTARIVGGALVVVTAIGAGLYLLLREEPGRPEDFDRAGSELVTDEGRPMGFADPPASYRIVYRDETADAGGWTVTTEEVLVRRPFDSIVRTHSGPPGSGEATGGQRTAFGVLTTVGGDGREVVIGAQPALAASDLRPDLAIEHAVERGDVQRGERRRVLGRECQVYRSGGPMTAGDIEPFDPEGRERAETCFDATGFLLEELWWIDERPVRRRLAVELEVDPQVDDEDFPAGAEPTISVEQGSGSVREVDRDSRPEGAFLELGEPVAGFTHTGRYAVVWAQMGGAPANPVEGADRTAAVLDVWRRGPDVVLVERGGTRYFSQPFDEHPRGETVELGPVLGTGQVIMGLRGNEVRVLREGGSFVRILGTVAPEVLVGIARSLHEVHDGEGLVYLDEPGADLEEQVVDEALEDAEPEG